MFHKWNPTLCDFLCLASFTCQNVFKIYPYISISFILILDSIPLYVDTIICLSIFSTDAHLSCFYFLTRVNSMTMDIDVQVQAVLSHGSYVL